MIRKIRTILLLGVLASFAACSSDEQPGPDKEEENPGSGQQRPEYVQASVVSFNVRVDNATQDGENRWDNRKAAAAAMLCQEKPLVAGLQEAQAHQITYLARNCSDYQWYGLGRDTGTVPPETLSYSREETMAIFWDATRVEVLDKGTFWLSETPEKVSKVASADYARTCTWCLFRHRETGVKFYHFNTHLATESAPRREQMEILIAQMKRVNSKRLPAFLTGDFNTDTNDAVFESLRVYLSDARAKAPQTDALATWNDYGAATGAKKYDHIFYLESRCTAREYHTLTKNYGAPYISDHYPVQAVFSIQK